MKNNLDSNSNTVNNNQSSQNSINNIKENGNKEDESNAAKEKNQSVSNINQKEKVTENNKLSQIEKIKSYEDKATNNNNKNTRINQEVIQREEPKKRQAKNKTSKPEMVSEGIGTPVMTEENKLKKEIEKVSKEISELNESREKYKATLKDLLATFNQAMSDNADVLYSKEEQDQGANKEEKIKELKDKLEEKKKQVSSAKSQNKIFKQQYELMNKEKPNDGKNNEFEEKIDVFKSDNLILEDYLKKLKTQSMLGEKKLEDFSGGNKITEMDNSNEEKKMQEMKLKDCENKLNSSKKQIENCQIELETLLKNFAAVKKKNVCVSPEMEEEISKLREDLTGTEEEIYERVQENRILTKGNNTSASASKTLNPNIRGSSGLRKGNSLKPLNNVGGTNLNRNKRGYQLTEQSSRSNLMKKNGSKVSPGRGKSPGSIGVSSDGEMTEFGIVNYDDMTDYEYKKIGDKKKYLKDMKKRIEICINESKKSIVKKVNEAKESIELNSKHLSEKKAENELLKNEVNNLDRLLFLTKEENKIRRNIMKEKLNMSKNKKQKIYLSSEYLNSNSNNKNKEQGGGGLNPTQSNSDITRNDLLNDLKVLGEQNPDENNNKISGLDLSNINEDEFNGMNESVKKNRMKALDELKQKYNQKDGDLYAEIN